MTMKILSIAYPFAPVGPAAVGDAEQVLAEIDDGLVAAGHRSVVVACEGSGAADSLYGVALPDTATLTDQDRSWSRRRMQAAIDRALGANRIDVVHMHGRDFSRYALPPRMPVVVTLHMPSGCYPAEIWKWHGGRAEFCCVSHAQRKEMPAAAGPVRVIENGVEIPDVDVNGPREAYAMVLGPISPEKNAHEALDAGTRAGIKVLLAGPVFPHCEHLRYFEEQIRPRLALANGVQHEFLGTTSPVERRRLLSRAKCLLHPTLAPETSSLVAMEAMAVGTPVIAYPSGGLREIVTDGVTGHLVNGVDQMVDAIGRVETISPARCRAEAEGRFDRERMVRSYLELYEELLERTQQRRYA